jgi:hypothetical protein
MACQRILAGELSIALGAREWLGTSVWFVHHISRAFMCGPTMRLRVLSCLWRRLQSAGILAGWKIPCRTIRCSVLVCVLLQYRQLSLRPAVSGSGRPSISELEAGRSQWEGRKTPSVPRTLQVWRGCWYREIPRPGDGTEAD